MRVKNNLHKRGLVVNFEHKMSSCIRSIDTVLNIYCLSWRTQIKFSADGINTFYYLIGMYFALAIKLAIYAAQACLRMAGVLGS